MAGGTKNEREIKKPLNGDEANRCRARRLPGKRRIDEIADNRKDRWFRKSGKSNIGVHAIRYVVRLKITNVATLV